MNNESTIEVENGTDVTDFGLILQAPEGIRDPYPVYDVMRGIAPVHWSESLQAWLLTCYEDVHAVVRDHERFSSAARSASNFFTLPPEVQSQLPMVRIQDLTPGLDNADPPIHTYQRVQVMQSMTPRRLASRREEWQSLCRMYADILGAESRPEVIEHFSTPLAYDAILGIFGAPVELRPIYDAVARTRKVAFRLGGSGDVEAWLAYEAALVDFRNALESIYDTVDRDSVIGSLLHPPPAQQRFSDDELFAIIMLFIAAGIENMFVLIPMALFGLLSEPEQLELVTADPAMASLAFEEATRWNVPNHVTRRVARDDTEIRGSVIKAGDYVFALKGAANRDPTVWVEPERYIITRDKPPGGSLSFGQGIHFCSGVALARLLGPLAINACVDRFPNMRLVEDWQPEWHHQTFSRILTELPLALA